VNRPVRQKSDLIGLKLRVLGLAAEVYKTIGSTVVALPLGEVYAAAQTRAIDGGQYLTPQSDLEMGFANLMKPHYYHPSSIQPAYTLDLYVNRSKWNALSPDGREVIEKACRETADDMVAEQERIDQDAIVELKKRGVPVAPLPPAVERELQAATEKVLTEQRRDPYFDKIMKVADQLRPNRVPVTQR
jgi:TRAP-type mannitol/chloroaromatic compound transport system substrate-binding protein